MTMTAGWIVEPIDIVSYVLQRELPSLVEVFFDPFLLETAEERLVVSKIFRTLVRGNLASVAFLFLFLLS